MFRVNIEVSSTQISLSKKSLYQPPILKTEVGDTFLVDFFYGSLLTGKSTMVRSTPEENQL